MDLNGPIPENVGNPDSAELTDDAKFLSDIIETQTDLASVELDPAIFMQIVAERMQKLANADGATVQLLEGDKLVCRAVTGIMQAHIGLKLTLAGSLAGLAVRTCCFQYAENAQNDPRVDRDAIHRVGFRSIVAVPLIHNGRGIGAIIVLSRRASAFQPRHIAALRLMAGLVVASLVHAAEFEIKKRLLTERTTALISLGESEQRFRNLFEHASDAVFLHDLEGRFLDVNVLACQNLGYSREELIGMCVTDVETTLDPVQVKQRCAQLQDGTPVMFSGIHVRRDGSRFPVEVRIVLIDHGGQKAIFGIVRDVSERQRIEAALRDSEQRFRNLFEHASDAIFVHDLQGRFLDANLLACKGLGYSREQLLSMDVADVQADFDLDELIPLWAKLKEGKPTTINGTHVRRDGTTFPVEVRVILVEFAGQKAVLGNVRDVSERKRIEAALRESQERFYSAFEHAAIGMALVSLEGRFLQVNQSLCRIVGYTGPEMLVKNFQSITHPDDLDADLALARKLIAGEISDYHMVKHYIHRAGHVVWVLLSVSLIRDEAGKPTYFVSQVQDITKRQAAEEALRVSEEEYRAIFDLAGVGKVQAELKTGRYLRVNAKFCEMIGYSADELRCMTFSQITHPDDNAKDRDIVARMLSGEINETTIEKRYVRKDGGVIRVLLNLAVRKDASGQPVRTVGTVQDITQRQEAVEALRTSEEEYRAIFELAATGKAHLDLHTGRFLRVNAKFCQMLGYSAAELQTMTFSQVTYPEDLPTCRDATAPALRGEINEISFEKRYVRKDGNVIWAQLNLAILKDAAGRPARSVGTIQDITDRKHAEWLERDRRRVLEMVALGMPFTEVLDTLAQAIEWQIGGALAAVFMIQHGNISIHGPSLPKPWLEALLERRLSLATKLSSDIWDTDDGLGVTLIPSDEPWKELRPVAVECGIVACWAIPIRSSEGTALGLLSVFCPRPQRPTASEAQTLNMYTKLASICIDHHHASGQLSRLVTHDRLTGLPNRMMFEDRIQQALALAAQMGRQVVIMALDIDKFKSVNDSLGHQAGDQLLQQCAQRLRGHLRESDTIARMGGDEFALVLPELETADRVSFVAQTMVECMVEPFPLGDQMIPVTVSIGVARFPEDGKDPVVLMKKADDALYRAKQNGRNGFSF